MPDRSMLSTPYAFLLGGWIPSLLITVLFALLGYYSACIIFYLHQSYGLKSYTDMGHTAFGKTGNLTIRCFFFFDLFFTASSYLVLISDSLLALFPWFDSTYIKLTCTAIVIPVTYLRTMGVLSYGSILGVLSFLALMVVLIYNGLSTDISPGSLHRVAGTTLFPPSLFAFPMIVGLMFEGTA